MTIPVPHPAMPFHPQKRRRTATSIMAGDFDPRPKRDVLTSMLNGVGIYKEVERDEEERAKRKREKKVREKELRKAARARQDQQFPVASTSSTPTAPAPTISTPQVLPLPAVNSSASGFWKARPQIHIPSVQRSVSITPSPPSSPRLGYTPASTPGPSMSSSTSRTSSKRPHTPGDDELMSESDTDHPAPQPRQRKKRMASKKGWKGWVEGSPPPSDKLINLDAVPPLQERRTRSGKNFDAY